MKIPTLPPPTILFLVAHARTQKLIKKSLSECPPATDGMERFACPTPDRQGRYRCIDDHVLCDGFVDCPEGADEDRQACMFYKTVSEISVIFIVIHFFFAIVVVVAVCES